MKLEEDAETKNSESPARRARTSRITSTDSRGGWWKKPPDGGEGGGQGENGGGETGQAGGKKIIHQKTKKEEESRVSKLIRAHSKTMKAHQKFITNSDIL